MKTKSLKAVTRLIAASMTLLAMTLIAAPKSDSSVRLKGTVVDSNGAKVSAAVLEVYSFKNPGQMYFDSDLTLKQKAKTRNGNFEVSAPRDGCLLLVRKEGFAPQWKRLCLAENEDNLQFVLSSPSSISGKLVDKDQKPCAKAEVYVVAAISKGSQDSIENLNLLNGEVSRGIFKSKTDREGNFEIKGLPKEITFMLGVHAPGFVIGEEGASRLGMENLPYSPGQKGIELVLEPAGVIEGLVKIDGVGKVPPTEITLQNQSNPLVTVLGVLPKATSGPDGKFRIVDVPQGTHSLKANFSAREMSEWVADVVPVTVEAGETSKVENPIVGTRGGLLEISVTDSRGGKGISNASVFAYKNPGNGSLVIVEPGARTGLDGKVQLRVPPDSYQVAVNHKNRQGQGSGSVEAGKTNTIQIELPSPRVIKGVVAGPDGKPAAGIPIFTVGFYGNQKKNNQTDKDGRFEVELNSQPMGMNQSVTIVARDLQRDLAASVEVEEEKDNVELKLEKGITITGEAESEGKPVQNPDVSMIFWTGNRGMHLQGWATNGTKAGSFVIKALPLGHKYGVIVSAKGYGQMQTYPVQEVATETAQVNAGKFDLKPARLKLSGLVQNSDGKPVKGASVNISGDGQPNANTQTDKNGKFKFDAVCEGLARLSAYSMNQHGSTTAQGGDTNAVIEFGEANVTYSSDAKTGKLQGVITDPEGKSVKGATIKVYPSEYGPQVIRSKEDGSYTLRWAVSPWQLESGDPVLIARDVSRNLAIAKVFDPAETNISAKLQPAWTLKGKVQDKEGKALAKATVTLRVVAGRMHSDLDQGGYKTDEQGQFEIKAIPPGPNYYIGAGVAGYGHEQREFDSQKDAGVVEVEPFVLSKADKIVSGVVLQPNDKPAAGAYVQILGDGHPQGNVQTDKQGRFKLPVCDGEVRVYANGENSYGNVNVMAGDTNVVINLRGYDQPRSVAPARASLVGNPLPDLKTVGLAADAAPANQPVLLCLLDAEQRPSRRVARLLSEKTEALKQKGVCTILVQCVVVSDDTVAEWTNSAALPFALGRVKEKSPDNRWATEVGSLPWLILKSAEGKVVSEGFSIDELDKKLEALKPAKPLPPTLSVVQ